MRRAKYQIRIDVVFAFGLLAVSVVSCVQKIMGNMISAPDLSLFVVALANAVSTANRIFKKEKYDMYLEKQVRRNQNADRRLGRFAGGYFLLFYLLLPVLFAAGLIIVMRTEDIQLVWKVAAGIVAAGIVGLCVMRWAERE